MLESDILYFSTIIFSIAILHSFFANKIEMYSHKYPYNSFQRQLGHYLGEVEIVFGFWSFILFAYLLFRKGFTFSATHFSELNFTEAKFVSLIMLVASTKPIIKFSEKLIFSISRVLPFKPKMAFYLTTLILGPLLGSFITEPAAMAVTGLILLEVLYTDSKMSMRFKYATLALLFVNISVGGTLTHFAAPPVVMVATKWNWGMLYMLEHFGYKSVLAVFTSTALYAFIFRRELKGNIHIEKTSEHIPWFITLGHLILVFLVVLCAHYGDLLIALIVFFLGVYSLTKKYQDPLKLKSSVLVGFFLAGLIYLGSFQSYWLNNLITSFSDQTLNIGATLLTSITDNALITYLGSLANLSESSKYYLLSGAVTGGGLTVIANAPNPIGLGLLRGKFGEEGISPLYLFLWALIPTLISAICFLFLPSFNF